MPRLVLFALLLVVSTACAPMSAQRAGDALNLRPGGPPGHMVRVAPATFRITPATEARRASFELTGSWVNPPGAAAIDSLEVWGYGFPNEDGSGRGQRQSFVATEDGLPTTATFTWTIDPIMSYAGSAIVCVVTWRNGRPGGTLLPLGDGQGTDPLPANCSPRVPYAIEAEATPLVTGVSASVRIIP